MSALEQHYSVKTVAELYDLKEDTVRKAICRKPGERGHLRSVVVGRGARRIPVSALQEWLSTDAPTELQPSDGGARHLRTAGEGLVSLAEHIERKGK